MMSILLSREEFEKQVFNRDKNICVVPWCDEQAADAHHIIERKLWEDLGYYIENGASLCAEHHIHAERNFFPPMACRQWAGIATRVLPEQLNPDVFYDKWGSPLKPPTRKECKYPTTLYLPFSPGGHYNKSFSLANLLHKPLIVTIKMDGANVVLRSSGRVAGRNSDTAVHSQYDLLKAKAYEYTAHLPEHIQLFGEWLYAKHSIHYQNLQSYLQVFAAYDCEHEMWLSWEDTIKWAGDIPIVEVLESGLTYKQEWELVQSLMKIAETAIQNGHEGIVVRSMYPFHYSQFSDNVAKYVRANHVQTGKHWSKAPMTKNRLHR